VDRHDERNPIQYCGSFVYAREISEPVNPEKLVCCREFEYVEVEASIR